MFAGKELRSKGNNQNPQRSGAHATIQRRTDSAHVATTANAK
jgi:hypothetical protein